MMTDSKDLLLAILSMDAYNQGYGKGLDHGKTQIGIASVSEQSDILPNSAGVNAGFYAISYTLDKAVGDLATNTTVISYRGTDRCFV